MFEDQDGAASRAVLTNRPPHVRRGEGVPGWAAMALCLLIGLMIGAPSAMADTQFGGTLTVEESDEEVTAFGGVVQVVGPVRGDTTVIAGTTTVPGTIEGDASLISGSVEINGSVTGSLEVISGSLRLGPDAVVGDDFEFAGGSFEMDGVVKGSLEAAAGSVIVRGRIEGNVEIAAGTVVIEPGASFGGNLEIFAPSEPVLPEGVEIAGTYTFVEQENQNVFFGGPALWTENGRPTTRGLALFGGAILVAGLFLLFIVPKQTNLVVTTMANRPMASLATGFAFLFLAPVAALALCLTVLGIVLGLPLLAVYPLILALGFVYGVVGLARGLAGRLPKLPGALGVLSGFAVVLVLILASLFVPMVGAVTGFAVLVVGTGGLTTVLLYGDRAPLIDPNPPY